MAKKPTKKSQAALARKLITSTKVGGATTAKLYAQWCKNDAKLRKPPKPPKVKGAKR